MEIRFYNTSSENNRIGKTLLNEKILQGTFKNAIDLSNPVIVVNTDLLNFNYCYIPELNRYYFINKIEITRTNLYTVSLHIDVLETYKEDIKKLQCIVSNSTGNPYFNGYVNGVDVRTDYTTKFFENNFEENGEIILVALYGQERAWLNGSNTSKIQ